MGGTPFCTAQEINNNFWGSHAVWTGVKCRDVLRTCGVDVDGIALGEKPLPAKYLRRQIFAGVFFCEWGFPKIEVPPNHPKLDHLSIETHGVGVPNF